MAAFDQTLRTRLSKYLTSDLLDQLPESVAVTQSIQRLNSLHKTISSFLPSYIATDDKRLQRENHGTLTDGTFMFADVSGFTALSEKLMIRAGAEGIEILTKVFNDYFAIMLEILAKSDGHLLKFAGDALLTFFPAEIRKDEFSRAVNTGLRMQRAMAESFQPIQNDDLNKWFDQPNIQLTMSIGISRGKLFEALVGNADQRDHMIMGRLPGEADEAENAGVRDEVIINSVLQEAYADKFETRFLRDGFYQVVDNFGDELGDYEFSRPQRRRAKSSFLFSYDKDEENLLEYLQNELARIEVVSRFVSSEIVNKLVVKGDHIESENRLATVIFVHFTGFAELLEIWGEEKIDSITLMLSRYYSIMRSIIAARGGVLTRSDPYQLGSKLLITFGAPVSHPDDPERAVETALEMNRQLEISVNRLKEEFPNDAHFFQLIKQRIGITQGDVFAGEVGWRQRREYTVMGDNVNLAARLMGKANFGQVIVSQNVWDQVSPYFKAEKLLPFSAKGKSQPIQSYAIQAAIKDTIARTSDTPFIGRDVILLSLNMALQQVKTGLGRLRSIALHGDVGVGKTRLAKQLAIAAESSGFMVAWATCRSRSGRKATWSTIIAQLLGLSPIKGGEEQQQVLRSKLADMDLGELEEVFSDLLFNTSDISKRSTIKARKRSSSKARTEIFDKLSSDETILEKSKITDFRAQMDHALKSTSRSNLPWNELQIGMSLTEALKQFLGIYTQETSTLIIIDDLHKEDHRALNILRRVINELNGAQLMIVATYESTKELVIDMRKVVVSDLPEEQTHLMTSAMLNVSELGPSLSKFIWESTSGRPLFIESLLQALSDKNQLEEIQGLMDLKQDADIESLPDDVRGLIISRIDSLSNHSRILLRAASILDDNFSEEALRFVSEIDVVDDIIGKLLKLQILEDQENGFYHFRHGVTQQAVYEELTRQQRQSLHLKVADYYGKQKDSEERVLSIVYHLLKAGVPTRAVSVVTSAAKAAEEKHDIDQALEFYSRALDIFPNDKYLQEQVERLRQL